MRWNKPSVGLALWSIFAAAWAVLAGVDLADGNVGFAIVGLIVAMSAWVVVALTLRRRTTASG
jgi:hypothetical protein